MGKNDLCEIIPVPMKAPGGLRQGMAAALLVVLFLLLQHPARCQQARTDSSVSLHFLKADVELPEPGSYFNVLEIRNGGDRSLRGLVQLNVPAGWRLIGPAVDSLELAPGATRLIPVRLSVPGSTIGGVSFVIGAELLGEEFYDYANSYVSVRRKSRWDMRLNTSQVYLSDYMPYGEVQVNLKNTGNSNELIKLSFDLGGMIEFIERVEADSFLYVEVPAYRDTSVRFRLQRRNDLSYAELKSLNSSWESRNLHIKASTSDHTAFGSVRATPLESSEVNSLPFQNTPLNTEVILYNLLSQQRKKASVRVYGTVLFPREQQLTYSVGYYNLFFDPEMYDDFDPYAQLRFMVRYTDPRSVIWLGDRIGLGVIHTLTGRGISASHMVTDRDQITLNVVQNPYGNNFGGFAGYAGKIGKVGWNAGVTLETTTNQAFSHYSLHLGGNYQLNQRHSFRLLTVTTLSNFADKRYLEGDTAVAGIAYQFHYRYNSSRLRINLENTNTMFTYLRNSGINLINLSGNYLINDRQQLKARYYRTNYTSTQYPYNFANPANTNINENARLLYSLHRGKVIYQVGPQYFGTVRNVYIPADSFRTRYVNYQPGLLGSVSFRLGNQRSISPNGSFQMMFYNYERLKPGEEPSDLESRWTYSLGINYYDQAFKLTAYYTTGEAAEAYRSAVIQREAEQNQSFHIRPYYERYFFEETFRLSAYFNYSYYMPSMRENMLFNLTGNIFVKQTWDFFASFNVYRVSRRDTETGRITSNDLNLFVGIRKAFDIKQPRLGYYNLTIVGFSDQNGDGVKSEDEKPISNVLVNISRDPYKNVENKTGFSEISMITDPTGEIYYENIPVGVYDLSIIPLSNLENLYFLHGENQTLEVNDDLVYYLPLVESYKIKGRIIIDRDPNSNDGGVTPEGIRITAVSETGETYTALTSSLGTYVLDLPKATSYEVSIHNVFGERFRLERGNYRVQFTENKVINLDFKFTELRRGIRFNGGEQYYQFNLGNGTH
jgi:hypothetical protein